MRTLRQLFITLCLAIAPVLAADPSGEIDFNRAREIFHRRQNGETISTEDQAYLQKAMEARRH
jgi:hypothetical protein